ncbi:MAG TPA: AsmA family protein [Rhizomicrobium sp.]|nr:AsmA family protein [Rhizomicrobium sp.]
MTTDHHPGYGSGALDRAWLDVRRYVESYRWSWPAFAEWLIGVLLLTIASAILILYFLDWNKMRGPVGRYVSYRLGREVRIEGPLKVKLFSWTPSVDAGHVVIANPGWTREPHAADIGRFQASVRLMPLFGGKTIIPYVTLDKPDIVVIRDLSGRTNWDFGSSSGKPWTIPPIRRFVVRDGHVRIDDRVRKVLFEGAVSSSEQPGAGDRAFRLTGDGRLNRNKFTADVHGGPLLNVDVNKPYRFAADIHSGTTHVTADAVLPKPFHLGRFGAKASFSGASMADLYYLTGLVFPMTPPYRLSADVTREGSVYSFKNMTGVVGQSDLHGEMTAYTGQTPTFLKAVLASKQLRFVDLGPFIGAKPVETKAAAPVALRTRALPDTPLDVGRVRQMNADVQYDAASIASKDLPLREFHMHLLLDNAVMTIDPLTFDFVTGKLSGAVKVDARGAVPVSDVDARLSNIHLEQFVGGKPPPVEGVLQARAKLHAPGASVHEAASHANGAVTLVVPSGKVRKAFAELTGIDVLNGLGLLLTNDKSDADLRCALVRFDARGGTLATERFTIDTESVLIQGKGSVNLNDETVNMQVTGQPKEFRIGRVRAPITIGGTLSNPSLGIEAGQAVAQGGIAAALGFLNPIAAVLAFVDPGLAKDANCAALTANAAQGPAPVRAAKRVRH